MIKNPAAQILWTLCYVCAFEIHFNFVTSDLSHHFPPLSLHRLCVSKHTRYKLFYEWHKKYSAIICGVVAKRRKNLLDIKLLWALASNDWNGFHNIDVYSYISSRLIENHTDCVAQFITTWFILTPCFKLTSLLKYIVNAKQSHRHGMEL